MEHGEKKQDMRNILPSVSICVLAEEEVLRDEKAQVRSGSLVIPFGLTSIY